MAQSLSLAGTLRTVVAVVVALCTLAAAAQTPETPAQSSPYTFRSDVDLVLVDAAVRDHSGTVLAHLRPDDFRVFEDGQERPVRYLSRDELPIAIALVLDCSGSMVMKLRSLRNSAANVLSALKPQDEVAVFTFSSNPERVVDLTTDRERVADAFDRLHAGGSTDITDSLFDAAAYLKKAAPDKRRAIILLSDNMATRKGEHHQDEVIETAYEFETSIYSLRFRSVMNYTWSGALARVLVPVSVRKMVDETGGETMNAGDAAADSLRQMLTNVRTRYALGFKPAGAPDGKTHRIRVELSSAFGKSGKDYTVAYRRGYRRAVTQANAKN